MEPPFESSHNDVGRLKLKLADPNPDVKPGSRLGRALAAVRVDEVLTTTAQANCCVGDFLVVDARSRRSGVGGRARRHGMCSLRFGPEPAR